MSDLRAAAVVLAGGSGSRVGPGRNKVLLDLAGLPVVAHSLRRVAALTAVRRVVVVARAADLAELTALAAAHAPGAQVVVGGASRPDSERAAFALLADDVAAGRLDVVAVHDAARPLADADLWGRVLVAAAEHGGAVPVHDPGPLLDGDRVRRDLVGVATPQAFRAGPLLAAYDAARAEGFQGTDTASYLEHHGVGGVRVAAVASTSPNLKITWPGDLVAAARLLG